MGEAMETEQANEGGVESRTARLIEGSTVEFCRLPWRTSQYCIEHFAATGKESVQNAL